MRQNICCLQYIVSDGWSIGVLDSRVMVIFYAAMLVREASPTTVLTHPSSIDFAHWQLCDCCAKVLTAQLAYWRQQLGMAGISQLNLPTDCTTLKVQTFTATQRLQLLKVWSRVPGSWSQRKESPCSCGLPQGIQTCCTATTRILLWSQLPTQP